jgi:isopenicillin-N N-acyltransferase-like protein
MIRTYVSTKASAADRGRTFGADNRTAIAATIDAYRDLFAAAAGHRVDLMPYGAEAISAIRNWHPALAEEIAGISEGARLPIEEVAALNARTEILGAIGASSRGECSTLVSLGGGRAVAVQTWDWHDALRDRWFRWTIEHPDGRVVHTVTEYGIVGKIGINASGVGIFINILHHERDGQAIGVPVHVLARSILDDAEDLNQALIRIASAPVSASSALTLVQSVAGETSALTAEVFPGGPKILLPNEVGVLLHTNHFLSEEGARGERETVVGPDSFIRYDVLRRRAAGSRPGTIAAALELMSSHIGGGGAVCAHPYPHAGLGDRYATLATIWFDLDSRTLTVQEGGPCGAPIDGPGLLHSASRSDGAA